MNKASDLLMASNLFASKGAMQRAVKGRGVKINRVIVDSIEETIENGDLLNAWVLPGGIDLIRNKILVVQHGKNGAFVQLSDNGPVKVEANFLAGPLESPRKRGRTNWPERIVKFLCTLVGRHPQ